MQHTINLPVGCHTLFIENEWLILSPLRAIYMPAYKCLVISDLHLGKTAHFRKHGIPVPASLQDSDLRRLEMLFTQFEPTQLYITGDMFHKDFNGDIDRFFAWKQQFSHIDWFLIPGNHDRLKAADYSRLNVQVLQGKVSINNFTLTHDCIQEQEGFVLCGHIHPGVLMQGKARQSVRLPSFVHMEWGLILPAFSEFTGLHTKVMQPLQHYAICNGTVMAV